MDLNTLRNLLSKYEEKLPTPPSGKKFQECYNLKTIQPTPEHNKIYSDVKNDFLDNGLNFKS